jgi:hypothetical protein
MNNIYAAPGAKLETIVDDEKVIKPKSAWVVQSFALIQLFVLLFLGTRNYYKALKHDLPIEFWQVGIFVTMIIFLSSTVFFLQGRHFLGRVLGLLFIALMGSPVAISMLIQERQKGTPEFIGQCIAGVLLLSPIIYWAYAFGFSKRARRYFGRIPAKG